MKPSTSVLVAALAVAGLAGHTHAATFAFTDNSGGAQAWTDPANWSGGVVPNPGSGDAIQTNLTMLGKTFLDLGGDRTFEDWNANFQGFGSRVFEIDAGNTITLAGATPTININSGELIYENVIAGTDGLTKDGNGTVRLNNAGNTFSGGLTLDGGTLSATSDSAFGDAGNSISVTANTTLSLSNGVNLTRDIALGSGATLSYNTKNTVTLSGVLSGDGGFTMNPSGFGSINVTLSSTDNTFTGNLRIGNDSTSTLTTNSLADGAGNLELRISNKGNTSFIYGAGADSALVLDSRQLILSGNDGGQNRRHVLDNANTDASNFISISQDVAVTASRDAIFELGGVNTGNNTIGGAISDPTGLVTDLVKADAGTWILGGDNTYTGTTSVNAGTLLINGSTAGGAVTVASGATLGGSGIVGGDTVVSGTLSPGNSPGTLALLQALELANNATYAFEAGDLVTVGTDLTLADSWTLELSGSDFVDGGSVTLFTYGGSLDFNTTGLAPTFDIAGLNFAPTGPLTLIDTGDAIVLDGISVIPEPASLALLGVGGLLVARRRRD